MSRRDLFRGLFGRARPTPAGERTAAGAPAAGPVAVPPPPPAPTFGRGKPLPLLRPPGAIEEAAFLAACTRCTACAEACPHGAIGPAPARFREATGTPILNPIDSPCRMCPDRPCVAACEPRALRAELPSRMGLAMISPVACLAHQGTTCSACVEQCPADGAMAWVNGRPVVNPAACTGCGVCQYVCPAPQNAVLILPTRQRPGAPA